MSPGSIVVCINFRQSSQLSLPFLSSMDAVRSDTGIPPLLIDCLLYPQKNLFIDVVYFPRFFYFYCCGLFFSVSALSASFSPCLINPLMVVMEKSASSNIK